MSLWNLRKFNYDWVLPTLTGSLFFLIQALAQGQAACPITAQDLQPHLNYIASPERRGRDDWGKIEARDYIIQHFKTVGLQPLFGESFLQSVPKFGDARPEPALAGQNVGGFVPGTDPVLKDEWIIVNAHYDHLGVRQGQVYPGADDNASGVAMLLEVARRFAKRPVKRSVAFVSFDLEEYLLWGSRWFLAHPPMDVDAIQFCLTADMIGRSLGGLDIPTVFALGSERSPQVQLVLDQVQVPAELEIARLGIDIIGVRSDYGPFYYRGIPFLFFSTGEHPDYHTPRDTLERLDVEKVARVSTVMDQVARRMANHPNDIEWRGASEPTLAEVEAVNRVTGHLLEASGAGKLELTDLQRFFIDQIQSKTNFMLRRGSISAEERKWLVRSTQILLFSLF